MQDYSATMLLGNDEDRGTHHFESDAISVVVVVELHSYSYGDLQTQSRLLEQVLSTTAKEGAAQIKVAKQNVKET